MRTSRTIIAAGLTTLALAGTVGVGIAAAADPTPAPSTGASSSASAKPAARKHPLAARALHGEVTLAGKKHRVVDFQRGTVQKVSATSITVLSKDGFTKTYKVGARTKVRVEKKPAAIAAVKTQDRVRVVATKKGSTVTANRIADRGAK